MMQLRGRSYWRVIIAALLLSGCAVGSRYVPEMKDVTEEPISGDYWYQKFTLYNPADSTLDCQISRTGNKLNLKSAEELSEVWRKSCRNTSEHDSRSGES